MAATFYKSDSIPASVAGDLTYARAVDTIVIDSNGTPWRSTNATTATYEILGTALVNASVAASTAITGTLAETAFDTSYTIPANRLSAGTVINFYAQGIATSTVGATTLTCRVRIGGVAGTLITRTQTVDAVDNDIFVMQGTITVRTAGAAGTIVGSGMGGIGQTAMAPMYATFVASTAVDTTTTQVLTATAQWSAADASTCRLDIFNVWLS